ncbi:serine/threonine-protein kinase Nek8-like [Saccoglossus kowalevskii]|uniref:non-specific serine/threonine protein kinase n=1 Tax=Saccoglossus kowalevskii TaxID=10224 RepID=A0ABM0LU82_SACKO|nr:PREDICTED: serine/threonine-protein kinase Nek8-like [Saccoglossus kowalevskii]
MEKYEKIRVVGRGAYGTVHLCRKNTDNKLVIIKQIPVEQMTKEERQAAINEVKVLSMLDHPNIIEYYENFLEDKALMIVMEYAEGGTLFEYLQQKGNNLLEEEEILHLFVQTLLALHHVHAKQILHRDLKTQNILLNKQRNVVKIGDFGISKVLSSKSKAYTVVGTPCYISPELCEGKPYNQKSDIWALGCVLYELSSLKRAFEAANLPALVLKIMRGTFSPISEEYSENLRILILSMLHLDPNKRPTISQIMAEPIVINSLMDLYTDIGKVAVPAKVQRPLSGLPTSSRHRGRLYSAKSSYKGSASNIVLDSSGGLPKPQALSTIYCWGNGLQSPVKLPVSHSDTQVIEVSTGRTQKAGVTKNGRLIIWEVSSVGNNTTLPGSVEQQIPTFVARFLEGQSGVTIKHVSCGDLFTACLTDRGILMTYGSGANGCLGHGTFHDVSQAKIVEELLGFEVILVSCGTSHVIAITNDHEVFSWGRGDNGRLGLDTTESHKSPQPVIIPDPYQARSVHCGVDCSIIVTVDGTLLVCGNNRHNKLGLDDNGKTPRQVDEVHIFTSVVSEPLRQLHIKSVAIGTSHTAVVTDKGECYTFGSNQFGQLGHGVVGQNRQMGKVLFPEGTKILDVACGDTYTVAIGSEGEVFSWGKAARGRLGRSEETNHLPIQVDFGDDEPFIVTSVSCSHVNTLLATKPLSSPDCD